jgi:hypothetical protein
MPTIAPVTAAAPDELRIELELLEDAIARLRIELDQARGERDDAHLLLGEAVSLRFALEDRIDELEAELERERTTSKIRRKLLADITDAGVWQRRKAIARAVRVLGA